MGKRAIYEFYDTSSTIKVSDNYVFPTPVSNTSSICMKKMSNNVPGKSISFIKKEDAEYHETDGLSSPLMIDDVMISPPIPATFSTNPGPFDHEPYCISLLPEHKIVQRTLMKTSDPTFLAYIEIKRDLFCSYQNEFVKTLSMSNLRSPEKDSHLQEDELVISEANRHPMILAQQRDLSHSYSCRLYNFIDLKSFFSKFFNLGTSISITIKRHANENSIEKDANGHYYKDDNYYMDSSMDHDLDNEFNGCGFSEKNDFNDNFEKIKPYVQVSRQLSIPCINHFIPSIQENLFSFIPIYHFPFNDPFDCKNGPTIELLRNLKPHINGMDPFWNVLINPDRFSNQYSKDFELRVAIATIFWPIARHFKASLDCAFLANTLLSNFASECIPRTIIGRINMYVACMMLAFKLEEETDPCIDDFRTIIRRALQGEFPGIAERWRRSLEGGGGGKGDVASICKMERKICAILKWDLNNLITPMKLTYALLDAVFPTITTIGQGIFTRNTDSAESVIRNKENMPSCNGNIKGYSGLGNNMKRGKSVAKTLINGPRMNRLKTPKTFAEQRTASLSNGTPKCPDCSFSSLPFLSSFTLQGTIEGVSLQNKRRLAEEVELILIRVLESISYDYYRMDEFGARKSSCCSPPRYFSLVSIPMEVWVCMALGLALCRRTPKGSDFNNVCHVNMYLLRVLYDQSKKNELNFGPYNIIRDVKNPKWEKQGRAHLETLTDQFIFYAEKRPIS